MRKWLKSVKDFWAKQHSNLSEMDYNSLKNMAAYFLLDKADATLYAVKTADRNGVKVYER